VTERAEIDRLPAAPRQLSYMRNAVNAWLARAGASTEDAREITQGVFLRIAEHLHEYDARYKFFSWIYRIAVFIKSLCMMKSAFSIKSRLP
jgi:DNA-directed RNA polymerase specialized sigma24 family protein